MTPESRRHTSQKNILVQNVAATICWQIERDSYLCLSSIEWNLLNPNGSDFAALKGILFDIAE